MADSLKYSLHHYGTYELQKLGVWEVESATRGQYWVVYIHGGAWRDPRVTHEAFIPSINRILGKSSPSPATTADGDNSNNNDSDDNENESPVNAKNAIAGFASIDYRLSPHPQFPQDAETTPPAQYRGAVHPHHLDDVRSALVYLQRNYGFGGNYLLVGHSAGGALAFQLVAGSPSSSSSHPSSSHSASGSSTLTSSVAQDAASAEAGKNRPALPAAIVSFGGLYDFTGINERYGGAYAPFFQGAFGEEERCWDEAAPIKFPGNYTQKFPIDSGSLILLGWSPQDTLVDEPEADNMALRLRDVDGFVEEGVGEEGEGKGVKRNGNRLVLLKDLHGDHDEIWRNGEGVARMVWIALRKLGLSNQ